MVNPSILLGVTPFLGHASALYIPHSDDNSVFASSVSTESSADAVSEKAQAAAARQILEPKEKGCSKAKKHGKKHGKKWLKKHHAKAEFANKAAPDSFDLKDKQTFDLKDSKHGIQVEKSSPLIDVNGVLSQTDPENLIPDGYIVVLKDGVDVQESLTRLSTMSATFVQNLLQTGESHPLVESEASTGFDITHIYRLPAFSGYAGKLLPMAAEWLAQQPEVAFVERDSKVYALKAKEEDQAPWGLARVSHRDPLGLSTYNKYLYDAEAGDGVTSYIVDTGIYIDHEDFGGRAVWGKTMPVGDTDTDAHGHGSHCAGTIGGKKYGVAKKAKLVAVKVLGSDGSGSMSDVIGGVEYVVEAHRAEKKQKGSKLKGSTANMSLGGGKSPALDIAVNAAAEAGVHFAVAAGNENQDACNVSPAASEGAVTVGATDVRDDRAYFSNYGKCVDIFAPGVNVLSVGTSSPSSNAIMSGTSMASPHIAGLLSYFVSLQPSTDSQYSTRGSISTKELKKYLIDFGTAGVISDLDSESPNVIAYNGGGGDISGFWSGEKADSHDADESDEDDESDDEHESFIDKVENLLEDVIEGFEESVSDLI